MELILAGWIIYRFFKMFVDAWNNIPYRIDEDGNAIYIRDGKECYSDGQLASDGPRVTASEKKQRYTIEEPDEPGGPRVYSLHPGAFEDDDDLVYPG